MLQLTTVFFLISLAVLALLHFLALEWALYWRLWWFDIVMHFFGGMVAALGFFTIKDFFRAIPDRLQYFVPIISGVIIVALLWELFEIYIGVPYTEAEFARDMLFDIAFGIMGGFAGFIVGHSIRKL